MDATALMKEDASTIFISISYFIDRIAEKNLA